MTNDIISEIKNRYFIIIVLAIIFFSVSFSLQIVTLITCSLAVLLVAYFLYITKRKPSNRWQSFSNWMYFSFILLVSITYVATSVGEIQIALPLFLSIPLLLLSGLIIQQTSSLWESENMFLLIISYIILISLAIMIFGYVFALVSDFGVNNQLRWVHDNTKVTDVWSIVYFSAQIFYSSNFGDIVTHGYSRLIVVIEFIFSAIIHIIVLGMIITNLTDGKKKQLHSRR